MKKIISIIAIVFAMTLVMSVSAFATGFAVDENSAVNLPEGSEVTPAEDSIAVSIPAEDGAEYSIILVTGNGLPTNDSNIAYINQLPESDGTVNFNVLPFMDRVADVNNTDYNGTNTIYIGSNAEGFKLISIPVTYVAPAVEPEYDLGYVNDDDKIDISDVLFVLDSCLGTKTLTETQFLAANVAPKGNVDNKVDISDVLLILDLCLGTVTSLN